MQQLTKYKLHGHLVVKQSALGFSTKYEGSFDLGGYHHVLTIEQGSRYQDCFLELSSAGAKQKY